MPGMLKSSAAAMFFLVWIVAAAAEPRIDAVQADLPEKAREAVERMPEQGRRLLAMRSYLRVRNLDARWSWTQAEIDAYLKSDDYVTAMAAVAAVVKAFELKNPGYALHVNTEVRSLDEQIGKWNANASVKAAADKLDAEAAKWLEERPAAMAGEFRAFLTGWAGPTVMMAAPGLSLHGRGQAFDFQIAKDGAVIAGADGGAIAAQWDGAGWDAKLQEAVRLSAMPFDGPLQNPREPWHYDYTRKIAPPKVAEAKEEPAKVEPAAVAGAAPIPAPPPVSVPSDEAPIPPPKPAPPPAAARPAAEQAPAPAKRAVSKASKKKSVGKAKQAAPRKGKKAKRATRKKAGLSRAIVRRLGL